jgi:glycosyltransferase involved in cell wall biosynthesis
MKLACISNNPFPYHTPILNELNRLVDLHVIYMAEGHPLGSFNDDWGSAPEYDHSFHWSRALKRHDSDFRTQISVGVGLQLTKLMPDAILFSSWGPLVWEPLVWKTVTCRKAVMWAESTRFSGQFRGGLSNRLRSMVVSSADAFVANGSQAAQFLRDMGVQPDQIVQSCLPSPMRPAEVSSHVDPECRSPRFLFVGRFISRKRPVELLTAFADVLKELPTARLTMIGDGPLWPQVASTAAGLGDSVRLLGRLEGDDLFREFQGADILVVPSLREVWGLVVNEALAQGLYVIATDEVGSAHDLLDEASGTIVPADDLRELSAAMVRAALGMDLAAPSTRQHRSTRVAECTPTRFAHDIFQAANRAINGGSL